jgi:putative redox protein
MEAKVSWRGGLGFTGTAETGFTVSCGTGMSVEGANDGFRPMELLAIGLAGCTGMDVISILQKKRQDVTAFEVQAHLDRRESHPKVFTRAVLEYLVAGHGVEEPAVRRAIELSATIYCPAHAMFGQVMPIDLTYSIFEDQGNGQQELVTRGSISLPEQAAP